MVIFDWTFKKTRRFNLVQNLTAIILLVINFSLNLWLLGGFETIKCYLVLQEENVEVVENHNQCLFLSVNLYSFIFGCAGSLLLLSGFLCLRWAGTALPLRCTGSGTLQLLSLWLMKHSCPMACVVLLGQGSNSYPLPWRADSYPVDHRGSHPQAVFTLMAMSCKWEWHFSTYAYRPKGALSVEDKFCPSPYATKEPGEKYLIGS